MDDHRNAHYQIHIRGLLSDRLLSAFPELQARARNHQTVLTGALPDQSSLHGVLSRIEALGLELLEVRRVRTGAQVSPEAEEARARVSSPTAETPPSSENDSVIARPRLTGRARNGADGHDRSD